MVKQMAKLAAVLLLVHAISSCYSLDTDSKVRVITRKAKQHSLLTEELLGGKPMNMTEEPKAVMNGLCPLGCSKCIASVSYYVHAETNVNQNTLTFIFYYVFCFARFTFYFTLHPDQTKANMASATLVSAYVLRDLSGLGVKQSIFKATQWFFETIVICEYNLWEKKSHLLSRRGLDWRPCQSQGKK